ncbi:MAG TPA: hypothetical protein VGF69_13100 [Thermoanaerobaculia bacterium]|jgi:hypothetical protein
MNSLKSACSFAKRTPVPLDQFEQQVEPLVWCQVRVELIVGLIGFFEAAKDVSYPFHASTVAPPTPYRFRLPEPSPT